MPGPPRPRRRASSSCSRPTATRRTAWRSGRRGRACCAAATTCRRSRSRGCRSRARASGYLATLRPPAAVRRAGRVGRPGPRRAARRRSARWRSCARTSPTCEALGRRRRPPLPLARRDRAQREIHAENLTRVVMLTTSRSRSARPTRTPRSPSGAARLRAGRPPPGARRPRALARARAGRRSTSLFADAPAGPAAGHVAVVRRGFAEAAPGSPPSGGIPELRRASTGASPRALRARARPGTGSSSWPRRRRRGEARRHGGGGVGCGCCPRRHARSRALRPRGWECGFPDVRPRAAVGLRRA